MVLSPTFFFRRCGYDKGAKKRRLKFKDIF